MEEQNEVPKSNNILPIVVVIALVALLAGGFIAYQTMNKKETTTQTQQVSSATVSQVEESTSTPAAQVTEENSYKDGVYTAVGDYTSPGGAEEIGVTLTLTNGVITDSSVEVKATRPTSKMKQEDFAAHYKEFVAGKNIDEVELTKVSGSSLSPKGFNDALEKIKTQAQS